MKLSKLLLFSIIGTLIADALNLMVSINSIDSSAIIYVRSGFIYFSILLFFRIWYKSSLRGKVNLSSLYLFYSWLVLNFFNILRGLVLSENYWDYKFLIFSAVPFTLISMAYYVGANLFLFRNVLFFFIKYVFPFGFLVVPLALISDREVYPRLMIPITTIICFFPFIKNRYKRILFFVIIFSVLFAPGFRANILKSAIGILFAMFYFCRRKIFFDKLIKFSHLLLFLLPLVFLILGVTGNYNIFSRASEQGGFEVNSKQAGESESLTRDTRTFLYTEVISSLIKSNRLVIGEGSAGSYRSKFFLNGAGEHRRYSSEVNILNILLYHGIIGVIIYMFLLYTISHKAIKRSNNTLAKILALIVASRWMLSFLEEFTQFDINFYFFWIIIGLISSERFLKFSDRDIQELFYLEKQNLL